jgi:hypothetical protein
MKKIDGSIFRFEIPSSKKSKNKKLLEDFIKYCTNHPEERFWQALRNWSDSPYILKSRYLPPDSHIQDTFYFEGKDK